MTASPGAASRLPKRVAVVGGGLAGMAAATALARHGQHVELFEARRCLGGRASSFRDPETGQLVDCCLHISMGCCTNLADFCCRTGIAEYFDRFRVLHFYPREGKPIHVRGRRWLPAPLHLLPALMEMRYLPIGERVGIARTLLRLARTRCDEGPRGPTVHAWLRAQGQSSRAIEWFWEVILVSALGEALERTSLSAARKVFVDGFLGTSSSYELLVPRIPLEQLYGARLVAPLAQLGIRIHLGGAVQQAEGSASQVTGIRLADGTRHGADYVVLAVPWWQLHRLLPDRVSLGSVIPSASTQPSRGPDQPLEPGVIGGGTLPRDVLKSFQSSAITGVHLWFDRPIMRLPHAVLLGRLSQWVFNRSHMPSGPDGGRSGYYFQVVISGSRKLSSWKRDDILARVADELRQTWPDARPARLLHGQVVTEKNAVFSPLPGLDQIRPPQRTRIPGLMLCGDWTATGWPATMEGAVRSGYLAAEAILAEKGTPTTVCAADPARALLAKMLMGRGHRR